MQNILESQVTDLTSLADSPIAIPGVYDMNSQRRQTSSAESPARDNGKRKSEDTQNGGAHTRAKRNRYISIAWYAPSLVPDVINYIQGRQFCDSRNSVISHHASF